MKIIDLDFQPTARRDLPFRELKDGGVVYEYNTDTFHSLNTTAAYIWILCDGNHTVAEIINSIKQNFSQFESDPANEVIKIIEKFRTLNLLTDD
ncbi:MAG TPA: PqqD family protein [Candidatus Marinimicrobia bacterium]|nr:PqqD family protein [Candidatus Neomarinimicrobiota bacterium]HRS51473.1 PqqD family protein [Candidatus Neomarinimicrobiota bacterium]HRU92743.1 PqqD family protein [Candidatus Neomarinimicrobiota bacterium]